MDNRTMENWDAGDFYQHFHEAAESATSTTLKDKFAAIASEVEPLDREFLRETAGCGRDMSSVMEELQSVAAKSGYCTRPRAFRQECKTLSRDVDRTVSHLRSLRQTCYV